MANKRIKEYIEASGKAVDFFNDMSAKQGLILLEELLEIKIINKNIFELLNKEENNVSHKRYNATDLNTSTHKKV